MGERGCAQANRVTLAASCCRDNSSGDDFGRHFPAKVVAGSLESFTHRRNRVRFERHRPYEWAIGMATLRFTHGFAGLLPDLRHRANLLTRARAATESATAFAG